VDLVGPLGLAAIRRELAQAAVLFGPDTFTGHFAAMGNTPQVTLQLPEHRAWINPATPSFVVTVSRNPRDDVAAAAARLTFVLHARNDEMPREWTVWAADWRCQMTVLQRFLEDSSCRQPVHPSTAVAEAIDRINDLTRSLPARVFSMPSNPMAKPNLRQYRSPKDCWRAIARWYVETATTDLSAAAYVLGSHPE
jgi:hypothetical protein